MTIRRVLSVIIISLILSAALAGCSGAGHDPRLERVAEAVDSSPADALSLLDSIDRESLGEKDRHYGDFLTVKARDKAYITHTSDSLISSVIGYYGKHDKDLYPEALYYGGRVYSDLGDFPTALRYFQQSLDLIPDDRDHRRLRGRALSQTGRLLNRMRLHGQATDYLKEVIRLEALDGDTLNMVYDLQLLGSIYMNSHKYDDALQCLNNALSLCEALPLKHRSRTKMYLAGTYLHKGEVDSAVCFIQGVPETVSGLTRNAAMAYAAEIYLQAGILDSAYMMATELIKEKGYSNRKTGYSVLLSDKLRGYSNPDTVLKFISAYREEIENHSEANEAEGVLIQNSIYNYQIHERERMEAERKTKNLQQWLWILSIALLSTLLIISYRSNRKNKRIITLLNAVLKIDKLRQRLERKDKSSLTPDGEQLPETPPECEEVPVESKKPTVRNLREQLRAGLLDIYERSDKGKSISPVILQSEAYAELNILISKDQSIRDDSPLWDRIEKTVVESSPDFKVNLQLLTEGSITRLDMQTALLIKCGVSPGNMATLMGRAKGTIVSRRDSLSLKIFDRKMGTRIIDGIIRQL